MVNGRIQSFFSCFLKNWSGVLLCFCLFGVIFLVILGYWGESFFRKGMISEILLGFFSSKQALHRVRNSGSSGSGQEVPATVWVAPPWLGLCFFFLGGLFEVNQLGG